LHRLIGVGVDGGHLVDAIRVQIGCREGGALGQLALDAGAELLCVGRVIVGRDDLDGVGAGGGGCATLAISSLDNLSKKVVAKHVGALMEFWTRLFEPPPSLIRPISLPRPKRS